VCKGFLVEDARQRAHLLSRLEMYVDESFANVTPSAELTGQGQQSGGGKHGTRIAVCDFINYMTRPLRHRFGFVHNHETKCRHDNIYPADE
jgi:hypothetical protein